MTVAELKVVRTSDIGAFLDAGTGNTSDDILLHKAQQTAEVSIGEVVKVFLYLDPKKRLTASMRVPKMRVGQIARLKIINVTTDGAFVDVGAERGIFMPFAEMRGRPKVGEIVWAKLYNDKSGRLAVSMKGAGRTVESNDERLQSLERNARRLMKYIRESNGFISEKLSPAFIQSNFRISKAEFKRALGYLYKQRLIEKSGDGFKLVDGVGGDA